MAATKKSATKKVATAKVPSKVKMEVSKETIEWLNIGEVTAGALETTVTKNKRLRIETNLLVLNNRRPSFNTKAVHYGCQTIYWKDLNIIQQYVAGKGLPSKLGTDPAIVAKGNRNASYRYSKIEETGNFYVTTDENGNVLGTFAKNLYEKTEVPKPLPNQVKFTSAKSPMVQIGGYNVGGRKRVLEVLDTLIAIKDYLEY